MAEAIPKELPTLLSRARIVLKRSVPAPGSGYRTVPRFLEWFTGPRYEVSNTASPMDVLMPRGLEQDTIARLAHLATTGLTRANEAVLKRTVHGYVNLTEYRSAELRRGKVIPANTPALYLLHVTARAHANGWDAPKPHETIVFSEQGIVDHVAPPPEYLGTPLTPALSAERAAAYLTAFSAVKA